jgi:hypothetical protein
MAQTSQDYLIRTDEHNPLIPNFVPYEHNSSIYHSRGPFGIEDDALQLERWRRRFRGCQAIGVAGLRGGGGQISARNEGSGS